MSRSIEHQDRSGAANMPVGLFVNGVFHSFVNAAQDPYGEQAAERVLAEHAPNRPTAEALIVCLNHPDVPAVDCLICVPED